MQVVFDAYWWSKGPASLRHVLREIVLAWREEAPEDNVVLVVRAKHADQAREEVGAWADVVASRAWPQAVLAAVSTSLVARRVRADVILSQNFAPLFGGAIRAIYLHDVLFLTNPEWFERTERLYFALMPLLAPRADLIFTSSATEGRRISSRLRRSGPVHPVGLGLSTELVDGDCDTAVPGLTPGVFLLTVGRLNIRKNLLHVIQTCAAYGLINREFPLVVVGTNDGKKIETSGTVDRCVADGSVLFTGFLEDSQLRWLYRTTRLFLYLSLDEGFGMPPIEAAEFGADLVVSDIPVMRENLGGSATFVDPKDKKQLADAILTAMRREPTTARREQQSAIRGTHDWRRTVHQMRSLCQEARADKIDRTARKLRR